jgi:3-phosphoshikimate 1-carboxyvinyltransferase
MSVWTVEPASTITGRLKVPGDKSISHRALIFSALSHGQSNLYGLLEARDVQATASCLKRLGVGIHKVAGTWRVTGRDGALSEPDDVLDCGNSGTTMRLLTGVLASQPFFSVLTGDVHLRNRPMARVTKPLSAMGAHFRGRSKGSLAPIAITGGSLNVLDYTSPVASAQVKSALMLATLGTSGTLRYREPFRSRDHTERMLGWLGVYVSEEEDGELVLNGGQRLIARDIHVPADISSAAFFMVAASIIPGSDLVLEGVGVNPTRTGVIDVLRDMGASIELVEESEVSGEPVADIRVKYVGLKGTQIGGAMIPRLLDELPVLAVAAAFAEGQTIISDAKELRVKESDRIHATVMGLKAMGVNADEREDGMVINGGLVRGGKVFSQGDHRISMAFAVAAMGAQTSSKIMDTENVATSYPNFRKDLKYVAGQ